MPLKVLISGAGVAGPALATFLLRANPAHHITIVERAAALRSGGQQIDLRGQGIDAMGKLGLLEAVAARAITEDGLALVGARDGRQWAIFGQNTSGQGRQALSSEYEIMREDLVNLLFEASLRAGRAANSKGLGGGLQYQFGSFATRIRQHQLDGDTQKPVEVTFSNGRTESFDLVVGADGQTSRTRRMVFGEEASAKAFKPLGMSMAYFGIPRESTDNATARFSLLPGRRFMATRTGNRATNKTTTQGYLAVKFDATSDREKQQDLARDKQYWAELFRGEGSQADRLIKGMLETDDFYAQSLGQVKMETYFRGRVVLLGDAGYCPSPMTGMGTACAVVGAYVLAGEIAGRRHGQDLERSLAAYDEMMRPFVAEAHKLPPASPTSFYVETRWGVRSAYWFLWALSTLKVDQLMHRFMPEARGGWKVPEYPELSSNKQE